MSDPSTGEGVGPTRSDEGDPVALRRRPRRVAVVGAGLTGLAAAHRLHRLDPEVDVVVLDAAPRAGGKVLTSELAPRPDGGALRVDEAADAFLARVPEALALCRELGLDEHLVTPAARSAFVKSHGELRRLPDGLVLGVPTDLEALAASGIVSPEGVARAGEDLTRAADGPPHGEDESVGSLVRRRLGDEVLERLVAPLLGGVNAGDADELSLAAGAPQLAAAVRDQPSLIAGLRAQRPSPAPDGEEAPVFYGLAGGSTTLIDALVAALPAGAVRLGTTVTALEPRPGGGFRLALGATVTGVADRPARPQPLDALEVDAVVLALPAPGAARLLAGLPDLDEVADEMAALTWASVVMTTLVLRRDQVAHPLDGSGYLIPAPERRFLTACSFGSSKWAHWSLPDRVVLRASCGHAGDGGAAVGLDDETLVRELLADLRADLGITGDPEVVRISRWPASLPQYRPGHLQRARAWQRTAWAAYPGLWCTGASFEGLGLPACVRQGEAAARLLAGG